MYQLIIRSEDQFFDARNESLVKFKEIRSSLVTQELLAEVEAEILSAESVSLERFESPFVERVEAELRSGVHDSLSEDSEDSEDSDSELEDLSFLIKSGGSDLDDLDQKPSAFKFPYEIFEHFLDGVRYRLGETYYRATRSARFGALSLFHPQLASTGLYHTPHLTLDRNKWYKNARLHLTVGPLKHYFQIYQYSSKLGGKVCFGAEYIHTREKGNEKPFSLPDNRAFRPLIDDFLTYLGEYSQNVTPPR